MDSYFLDHINRMAETLTEIDEFVKEGMIVGNVGISSLDDLIRSRLRRGVLYSVVPSIEYIEKLGNVSHDRLVIFDLTRRNQKAPIKFDLVILTEVLEHLFIEDEIVLENIWELLAERGLFLLTVPNAATLRHRVLLLLGRNIFWPKQRIIHGVYGGFGHIREYTFREVQGLLNEKFSIIRIKGINGYRTGYKRILNFLPRTYSNTILVIAKKK